MKRLVLHTVTIVLAAITLLGIVHSEADIVFADSPIFPAVKYTRVFEIRDTKFVCSHDSMDPTNFKRELSIYYKSKLSMKYKDCLFGDLYGSPGGQFAIGVSNSGLYDEHAYVIFDKYGKIIASTPHDAEAIHYCDQTVTIYKYWYDSRNPNVEFAVDPDGSLHSIRINGCKERLIIPVPE